MSALSTEKARYLVVGCVAVNELTEPRYTKDLDIWVQPTEDNARRVYRALQNFGAPLTSITVRDFMNESVVYQVGVPPVRITC